MANTTFRTAAEEFDAAAEEIGTRAAAVGQKAVDAVESGRKGAARGIQDTADTLRSAADRLVDTPKVREFAGGAAKMLDGTAKYLRDKNAKDMLSDLQGQIKANPMVFLIGALAFGFVTGRMLRRG